MRSADMVVGEVYWVSDSDRWLTYGWYATYRGRSESPGRAARVLMESPNGRVVKVNPRFVRAPKAVAEKKIAEADAARREYARKSAEQIESREAQKVRLAALGVPDVEVTFAGKAIVPAEWLEQVLTEAR